MSMENFSAPQGAVASGHFESWHDTTNSIDVLVAKDVSAAVRLSRAWRRTLTEVDPGGEALVHQDANVVWMWDYDPMFSDEEFLASCLMNAGG